MKDRAFLIWLHERLTEVHGESPVADYMHKLRALIKDTPPDKVTPNRGTGNSLGELIKELRGVGQLEQPVRRNCDSCKNRIMSFNQCGKLCGDTADAGVVATATVIRNWRESVGLHQDYDLTAKYIAVTDEMDGCPEWVARA